MTLGLHHPGIDASISQPQSSTMCEESEVPRPVPVIPRGPLWIAGSIPPLATLLGNLLVSILPDPDPYGATYLWVPVFVFFIIIAFTMLFHRAIKIRYKGRSLVFLDCAFALGQIIVCLALWIGSCLLVFEP